MNSYGIKLPASLVIIIFHCSNMLTGQAWYQQESGITNDLTRVYALDDNHAWAVGQSNIMVRTVDGGETWEAQYLLFQAKCIRFFDADRGIAAGNSPQILVTNDGGQNWSMINTGYDCDFEDVSFLDSLNGWMVGNANQTILHTCDGGITWQDLSIGNNDRFLYRVGFADSVNGWILSWDYFGADHFFISKTSDGGISWTDQKTWDNTTPWDDYYILDLSVIDSLNSWVAGWQREWIGGEEFGTSFYTMDGGATWDSHEGYGTKLQCICFPDTQNGWVAGFEKIHFTNADVFPPPVQYYQHSAIFKSIYFADTLNGWAVGTNGVIVHTSTGGLVSIPSYSPGESHTIKIFPNPSTGNINILFGAENHNKRDYYIQVVNAKGDLVVSGYYEMGTDDLIRIHLENYPSGIYFVKILGDNRSYCQKILKHSIQR